MCIQQFSFVKSRETRAGVKHLIDKTILFTLISYLTETTLLAMLHNKITLIAYHDNNYHYMIQGAKSNSRNF